MNCEQFGQQACDENRRTADRIGLMLDQQDPRTAADVIRQELYDRPGPLAIDLLQRIQQYDEPNVGADLKIQPMVRQVPSPNGGVDWIDTGDRSVVVDSRQYGQEQVAIIKGAPEQPYPRYPDGRYIEANRFDPFAMITSMFVGHLLNGQFSRWQNRPHYRQNWMDSQGGWYPQNDGQWGRQYRDYPYQDDSNYRRYFDRSQQYVQRNPNFWNGGQQQQWSQGQQPWRQGQDQRWRQQDPRYDQGQRWRQQQSQQDWQQEQQQRMRWLQEQQRLRQQQQGQDNRQPPRFGEQPPPRWQHPRQDDGRRPRFEIPPRQDQPDQRRDWRQEQPRFDRRPEQQPFQRREQPPMPRFEPQPRDDRRHEQNREIPRMQPQPHREMPRIQPQPQPQPHREMPRPQPQQHREVPRIPPQQQQQPRGDRRQGR
ncbi:hypothetical protein KF707_05205 [Candidatus Obscuribacterales bacterium]|nr:hypothetical protein [Candidatus Obscuribacterales bacterium]MBX3135609.1 hypothetical protein [Candidatus Obscuribacterales bacterium]MBX3149063.1 hypothetical protein [Candidatus Obscuribacterales bacterium]